MYVEFEIMRTEEPVIKTVCLLTAGRPKPIIFSVLFFSEVSKVF